MTAAEMQELEALIENVEGHLLEDVPATYAETVELDARTGSDGLRVRLMYTPDAVGGPVTSVWVYEGCQESGKPVLIVPAPPESAREVFWHPYAYAGSDTRG